MFARQTEPIDPIASGTPHPALSGVGEIITPERASQVVVRRHSGEANAQRSSTSTSACTALQYAMPKRFVAGVAHAVDVGAGPALPENGGDVLIDRGTEPQLVLGLTDEGGDRARALLRARPRLRGRGLGRSLLTELVAQARAAGLGKL